MILTIFASIVIVADTNSVMYPACFQKNTFNICENMPGVLGFYPINHPESKSGKLYLIIPEFLKLRFCGFTHSEKNYDKTTESQITRDGKNYRKIEITLSKTFLSQLYQYKRDSAFPFYLKQMIVLDAEKNSAGKFGAIYWKMVTNSASTKEGKILVNVLPPVKMPKKPTKRFSTGFSGVETITHSYDSYTYDIVKFLKGLTQAESYTNFDYDSPMPDKQFSTAKSSGSVCFFPNFRPDPLEREIRLGKLNHKYPMVKNHHNYYGLALSYMVDDPEGFFAKYLKDGIIRFKKSSPNAKYLRWDYEPLASQHTNYDLEVFSKRYLKLNKVLSYNEIQKNHAKKWSDFMHSQSEKLVKKYSDAVKKYWPEAKLVMVSGFMDKKHPENKYRSIYTPLDVRETEKYFDMHAPMIYWQGTDFYDDNELNLRYLKKPFMPWIDPSEHSKVFYERYTPIGVKQNILACAILGAQGIVFYPVASLDGAFFPYIAEAFDQISQAEDIINGKNITKLCKIKAANVIEMSLSDNAGKTTKVTMPQFDEKIRYCVRQKGNKFAVGLFNYNNKDVYLTLNIPNFAKNALVKIPANDSCIITKLPSQEKIAKELAQEIKELTKNLKFEQVKFGGSTVAWKALEGNAMPALMTGRCTFIVDTKMAAPRSWTCPFPTWDPMFNPRKTRGYLGKIYLMDGIEPLPLEFNLTKFLINKNRPSMILEHLQKPFAGFQEMKNKFEGLHITSQWTLDFNGKKAFLDITVKNNNLEKKAIPVTLKIQSFPNIGNKFGPKYAGGILTIDNKTASNEVEANFILSKEGKNSGMSHPRIKEYKWQNFGPATIYCKIPKRIETLIITPDKNTNAFYTWRRGSEMTAEFLTSKKVLSYGEKVTYQYIFEYSLK